MQLWSLGIVVSSPSGFWDTAPDVLFLVYFVASEINTLFACHNFAITMHDSFWPGWAQIVAREAQPEQVWLTG